MFLIVMIFILSEAINAITPESRLRERRSPQYSATLREGWKHPPPDEKHTFYSPYENRFKSIELGTSAAFDDEQESIYNSEYWRAPRDHNSRPPPPSDHFGRPPPPPPHDHYGRPPPPLPSDHYGRPPPPPPPDNYGRPPFPPSDQHGRHLPPYNSYDSQSGLYDFYGRSPSRDGYGRPPPYDQYRGSPNRDSHDYGRPPPHKDFDRPPSHYYQNERQVPPPPSQASDHFSRYSGQHDRPQYNFNGGSYRPTHSEQHWPSSGHSERPRPGDGSYARLSEYILSQQHSLNNNKPENKNLLIQSRKSTEMNIVDPTNYNEENLIRYIERIFNNKTTTASPRENELYKDFSDSKHLLKFPLLNDTKTETQRNEGSKSSQSGESPYIFDVRNDFGLELTSVDLNMDSEKAESRDQYLLKSPPLISKSFLVPLFQAMPVTPEN